MKHYPSKNIFNKIRSCLKDIINDHKKSDIWKTQFIIAIKFISSKDTDEERVMHSKSDNIEIMINVKADEIFDLVHLLYYKCHKEISNRG